MADQITTSLAQAKVLVMEGQKGADGKSPYIGQNGNWIVWNGADWVDTGVPAGMDEAAIEQIVEDYLDEHPVEVPVSSVNGKTGEVELDAEDVGALPADTVIPDAVTESTVAGWGFTKNTGTYSKPSGGIPASDLASAVQSSLGKADTALQTAPVSSVNGQTGAVVIPLAKPGNTHINVFNPEDANVVQGYIAAQGQINGSDSYWTTDYIPVSQGDVVRLFFGGRSKVFAYVAEYSETAQSGFISRTANGSYSSYTVENSGFIRLSVKTSSIAWSDKSTAMITLNDTNSAFIPYGESEGSNGLMSATDKKKLDGLGKSTGKKTFGKFLFISYSAFGSNAPNSAPHYEYCAQRDYDWIKADIQPTSDGGLVCCHDSGFTLDGNGRIIAYNASSATEIYAMTLAQATALVYASYPDTHVASIDDFLAICKKYGKTPYITIRDEHMDVVVPALMAALDKFALRDVAVINSSARSSLDAVRTADSNITMSLFVNPFGSSLAAGYNYCIADGNTMLGFFYSQASHTWSEFIADSTVSGYIANCIENGIIMWAGIESDASHVADLIEMGFSSIHTMQDRPSPIPTKTSDLTNDSGFQTAEQVAAAVNGKADKFLRIAMTASDTTATLNSNTFYVFPEMATLTPTLAPPTDNTIVNEYHFVFDSGSTATVLTLPASVLQPDGFTVEANMHYEISILEGAMTAQGWAVTA